MGVVVRRYIDILTIIINFPYSTCISSFVSSSIPTSLFIFKMFFRICIIIIESVDSISRDERGFPLTQYITNGRISRDRCVTHIKHHYRKRVLWLISNRMNV